MGEYVGPAMADPSHSRLLDRTGVATGVGLSLNGSAHFRTLVADAKGMLSGIALPSGVCDNDPRFDHEVNWSGFQLLRTAADPTPNPRPVPEPAGLTLAGTALLKP